MWLLISFLFWFYIDFTFVQGIELVNSTAMEDELNYENRTAISNITNLGFL